MRLVPCSSLEACRGLKFATSVGLPASPWIVSVPLPAAPLLELLEQALTATRASATAAAQTGVDLACEGRLMVGSPLWFESADGTVRVTGGSERPPALAQRS